mgnify:CR=1 FL=1
MTLTFRDEVKIKVGAFFLIFVFPALLIFGLSFLLTQEVTTTSLEDCERNDLQTKTSGTAKDSCEQEQ